MSPNKDSLDFEQSSHNPLNWYAGRKWRVMGISCIIAFLVGLNSSAPSTAFPEINAEFGISDEGFETSFFMITSWNLAAGLFPMITLSLMDTYGTYLVYIISYVLFILFVLPQALASNFATLIVVRTFAGAFGGTLQNGVEAVIANVFQRREEQLLAVTLYVLALVGGVTMGPVQGALVHILNWRWIFWFQLILYSALLPVVVLGLCETRGAVIQARRIKNPKADANVSSIQDTKASSTDIVETLLRSGKLLTTEFIVFSFMLWCAFSFGLIFISTESVALVFGSTFGFQPFQAGLIQIAMFIGEILGAIVCLCFQWLYVLPAPNPSPRTMEMLAVENDNPVVDQEKQALSRPGRNLEKELYLAVPAAIVGLSGGLFIYGWTGSSGSSTSWIIPAFGLALQGFAVQIILTGPTIYLTECYGKYAASAVAGIAVGENTFAAFLPLASVPMYDKLGFQWASSLLAFVGLALVIPAVALIFKGPAIRARSRAIKELSKVR